MNTATATFEVGAPRRQNLLLLRWLAIIATCYLLLFPADASAQPLVIGAVLAFLASNVGLHGLAEPVLFDERTLSGIVLSDSVITATAILASGAAPPRLLGLYFLVILIAAVGRGFAASLVAIAVVAGTVPLFLGSADRGFHPSAVLGIPFVFCTGAFYAYLSSHLREDREHELERARDAALESSRLKTAFLANMSHEIRTPLNVILAWIDAVEAGLDGGQPLDAVRRAGDRLIDTIDTILNFSRIETGAFEVRRVPLAVAETVRRCAEEAQLASERKGLRFECTIREPDAVVPFDEYCLTQALRNLLANAVKFTETGTVSVELCRDADGRLAVSIADTGVGIETDHLPRLFEPFTQEERGFSKRFEGSGLGLALTRSLLAMNGAELVVRSDKGRGSCFTIRFPSGTEAAASSGGEEIPFPDFRRGGTRSKRAQT